jgi:predicted dehydrogenase
LQWRVVEPTSQPTLNHLPPLPRDRSIGIGCIGAGFIMADCHLVAYRANGLHPIAIASQHPEKARAVAKRHEIDRAYDTYHGLLNDKGVQILDIAVPPDLQLQVVRDAVNHNDHIRGILAQKPLGMNYDEAKQIVQLCAEANIELAVNQNMRFDHSVRACKDLLDRKLLGEPVLATIDMRAIPHWTVWQQRMGWLTLRIMSVHHLDTFRYWLGDPVRIFASVRPDPRTAKKFAHDDGICLYILEYENGVRAMSCDDVWTGPARDGAEPDIGIRWRVEGTEGMARGTIGWPDYPKRTPSTIDYTTTQEKKWHAPRWDEAWFPDAFIGPMAELMIALEEKRKPSISGEDNLKTMALVDACYQSAREHCAIEL